MTDVELLARLVACEAGNEGNVGMAAVATVVMNRVFENAGEYGRYNSVNDVVFAPYQFTCATTVYGDQNIYNIAPEWIHYEIARWALYGGRLNNVGESFWFYNPYSSYCNTNFPNQNGVFNSRIGDHCFYNPTSTYYFT